jgi:hypothetical protein
MMNKNRFTWKHWNEAWRKQNETEPWDIIWSDWLDELVLHRSTLEGHSLGLESGQSARFRPLIRGGRYWTIYSFLTSTPKCTNWSIGSLITELWYSLSGSKQLSETAAFSLQLQQSVKALRSFTLCRRFITRLKGNVLKI